jgi:serine protease AprX
MDRPSIAAVRPRSRLSVRATVALAVAGATALTGLNGAAGATPLQTVVVTGAGDVAGAVRAAGGEVLARLPLIHGVTARLPRGASLPSYQVVPNRAVTVSGGTDATGPASTVRATLGLGAPAGEGAGTTVAVVDTGVADIPDLAGRLTHVDVTGDGTGDGYGHGTFVAGLVAGDGSSSGGAYAGVAPAADILDVRVAHNDGTSDLATVLAGLQAVATHPEVDVVNLSLSSGSPLPFQLDPLTRALDALWARGVTVVVPAGNDGADGRRTITSPGVDPTLITVGGLDEHATGVRSDDTVAPWSSQGPAPQGVLKPDLVAPGTHVVSTAAVGSAVWDANPGSHVGDAYMKGSGTSFSTAVTSGAAADLVAGRHDLTPDQVKGLLTGTAYDVPGASWSTGLGGLDLAAAEAAPAPSAESGDGEHGNGNHGLASFPDDPALWSALVDALLSGDEQAAAAVWDQLSPEARQWAARQWAARQWAARQWAASEWDARQWAASSWADVAFAARQWAARQWAARQWAARQWAARQWAASSWAARQWSARQWSARQWAADEWAARQWSARQWSADDWAARQWSARQWSARQWSARQWTARQWTATDWA